MVSLPDFKMPPQNLEAEKGVLSGVLMNNELMWTYEGDKLDSHDFYQKSHKDIFSAIKKLWSERKTIDVVTLGDQLTKDGTLDEVGGLDYLYELSTFLLTTSGCPAYSKIVKDKSILRDILKVSQDIIGDVYKEQDETTKIMDSIEKRIFNLTQNQTGDSIKAISEILNGRVEEYMEIIDNPEKINKKKVFSGYKGLDNMLSGFKPGELIILAARPAMGKTSFALNLLTNAALEQDKSVAMFSLEMSSESIADRIVAEVSGIPMSKITKGELDNEDFSNMGDAIQTLGDKKIFIDDKSAATVPGLKSKLRRLKIEKGALDLVVIDYLQLMKGTSYEGNRVQEISEISRGLKELAKELEVPIIALSQLSRNVEQRIDKKPQLSDLRESGSIEQDADSVIMLHREEYYDKDTDRKGATDVCVRKNRNGEVGEVELEFKASIMKFVEKESKEKNDGTF